MHELTKHGLSHLIFHLMLCMTAFRLVFNKIQKLPSVLKSSTPFTLEQNNKQKKVNIPHIFIGA